jgi:hypothetical protein
MLDYLDKYDEITRNAIILSINGPIPVELPPISTTTISYYRRSNQPIFKTRNGIEDKLDPHMTYESLWILAGIEETKYGNSYQGIVKDFEK